MTEPIVAITDYAFADLDIEQPVLQAAGCRVVSDKTGKDPAVLAGLVRDADCVITQFAPINAAIIDTMRKCRVIVRYGIGVDNVDLKAAAARGIPVCNVPDYCTDEVADHTLAMILDLVRRITTNAMKVRSGVWGLGVPLSALHSLKDMTVGVVAFGRIGREVVNRLRGFRCRILVHDPLADAAAIRSAGASAATLEELLSGSDLVTLHCPSTDQTRYMINADSLSKMKAGSLLVNVSRGTLVNTTHLVAALRSGRLAGYAADVTDPEPPPADYPLLSMENVLLSSHIASATPQSIVKLRLDAARTVVTCLQGGKLPNVVNGVKA